MNPDEALLSLGNPWRNPWQMMVYNMVIGSFGIIVSMHVMAIVFVERNRSGENGGTSRLYGVDIRHIDAEFRSTFLWSNQPHIKTSKEINVSTVVKCMRTIAAPPTRQYHVHSAGNLNMTLSPLPNRPGPGRRFQAQTRPILAGQRRWDLVCDKNILTEMTQTVLVVGMLIGTMTMTPVADKFGRKWTFLINACASSLVVFMTALVNNYYLFTALRFLLGIFVKGTMISGYVLACELFPAKYRTTAGVLGWIYWPVGMLLLAGIAYVTRNWRYLLIVTSLFGLLALPLVWLIPESIPWLVAMGRVEDARQIFERMAKRSNIELPMEYRLHSTETTELTKSQSTKTDTNKLQYTLVDIINSTKLRRYTFVLFYLWFAVSLVYSGLSLSSGTLVGNSYVNFSISGAVEIPAILITIPLFNRKFCITAAFGGITLCSMEVYPTTVRNIGLGMGIVGGKLGQMLSPYTSYFSRLAPWFLGVVFGSLTVVGAVLMLLLPETLGRPLPQTIEEAECRIVASRQKRITA
ncbi:Organic cation transporter protein [Lamellibrachia satsuma]|nr:Organic cation transporter protein [Lamellibrachia satsuma]